MSKRGESSDKNKSRSKAKQVQEIRSSAEELNNSIQSEAHRKPRETAAENINRPAIYAPDISLVLTVGGLASAIFAVIPQMADQIGSHKSFNFWCYYTAIVVGHVTAEVAVTA